MTFLADRWGITLAALSIVALLWWMTRKRDALLGYREIDPTEAVNMLNRENAIPIDLRDHTLFLSGHLQGAKNHPANRLLEAEDALQDVKTEALIVYCERGIDSARAASYLSKRGFNRVFKLRGGLTAWRSAGLPVSRSAAD